MNRHARFEPQRDISNRSSMRKETFESAQRETRESRLINAGIESRRFQLNRIKTRIEWHRSSHGSKGERDTHTEARNGMLQYGNWNKTFGGRNAGVEHGNGAE
jgi:hypothetical protein